MTKSNRSLNIGLVCPYSIDKGGGVQEVVLALQRHLRERGHRVKIITPKPRGKDMADTDDVYLVGVSTDFRTLSFGDTTSQVSSTVDEEKIDAILKAENFDILHFHEPWQPLLSRQLLQRSTSVNIGTFHAKVSEAMMSRAILRLVNPYLKSVLKYLHELTAVSVSGAEYVTGMTNEPITIIPNGIEDTKYKQVHHKKNDGPQKTILYVGRLENRKGVRYLLKAFELLSQDNPDVKLIIAGDGPDRERLELLAEDLKLKNTSFLGYISEELKLELLEEADLFCSPATFGESFGIVLLEAMSTGTVCVAGNNSGYADLMQGLGSISIVNPRDSVEFARRMTMLLYEPKLRSLWEEWAAEYIQRFSYPHVVDQYEELYFESLKQHGEKER